MGETFMQLIYGGVIVTVLAGGATTAYYFTQGAGAPEVVTVGGDLCRTDQALAAHRVIVVDTSDSLSTEERKLVRRVIDREALAAGAYEKVSVLAVESDDPYQPKRLFSACAPKKASDATGMSENPHLYGAVWKRRFGAPLDAAIETELSGVSQNRSPLIQSIWGISRLYDFGPDVGRRRLVITSDMLQNSSEFSQYGNTPNYQAYAQTHFGRLHLPNLRGVEVVIYYLARPTTLPLQTGAHVKFWKGFFNAAGASHVEVVGGTES